MYVSVFKSPKNFKRTSQNQSRNQTETNCSHDIKTSMGELFGTFKYAPTKTDTRANEQAPPFPKTRKNLSDRVVEGERED